MDADLSVLAQDEARLSQALPAARSVRDEPAQERIYSEYLAIANSYCKLASAGDSEALKRLVFLWWYSTVEPPFLSGLQELPQDLSTSTADLLEAAAARGLDEEFRRMLVWYYTVTDWHFHAWVPSLVPALRSMQGLNRLEDGSTDLSAVDLSSERGAMGRYFGSMRRAQAHAMESMKRRERG